jgi:choice-of-anchor A domain-containing protein
MRILSTLVLGAAALASAPSFAATLTASQILTQFNGIVTNQFSSQSDVEGRLVTGNLVQGATFYNKPNGSASSFAAVNAVEISATGTMNMNSGGSVNYQTSNAGRFNLNGGGSIVQQSPAFAMADFSTPLNALQSQLSQLKANSTVNAKDPNNFTFNETGSTAVFDLTTAQLQSAANIEFTGNAGTIIINVSGTSFTDNANINIDNSLSSKIIWNFEDAQTVSLRGWDGTILAGGATVSAGSAINGVLYAENYSGNGELHSVAFTGVLPVPEPTTYAMFGIGLAGVLLAARKRKQA